jgi:hypothetical protein
VTYGVGQTKILEAIVTPDLQPEGYVVACVLFSKMQDVRWRIVQSSEVLWNQDHGSQTILPIIPTDPMDQHHVVKI